ALGGDVSRHWHGDSGSNVNAIARPNRLESCSFFSREHASVSPPASSTYARRIGRIPPTRRAFLPDAPPPQIAFVRDRAAGPSAGGDRADAQLAGTRPMARDRHWTPWRPRFAPPVPTHGVPRTSGVAAGVGSGKDGSGGSTS